MAKARRPTFAAAERFLGFPRGGPSPAAVAPAPAAAFDDLPDLAEADVWYAAVGDPGSPCPAASRQVEEAEGRSAGGQRGAPRRGVQGGLSQAFGDGPAGRQVAASAPVEVPAWPARFAVPDAEPALLFEMEMGDDDDEDGKRGAGGWVPPHVYLARRQARASVVEGAGRTLKGRDMSRVRDAVWSRTGFDG
ncbi:unnamed protein product [Miscanthus lutarioriparius]|uniref:Senescence regulator n=1 Tax=Miscanthus lutarioriparius TaxID=422564 RepID=A0A811N9I2_9POAL|nr:unnamed protein product [Miscanthus lutarioriparius]